MASRYKLSTPTQLRLHFLEKICKISGTFLFLKLPLEVALRLRNLHGRFKSKFFAHLLYTLGAYITESGWVVTAAS